MKKGIIIAVILVLLLGITGFFVVKTIGGKKTEVTQVKDNEPTPESVTQLDPSVKVNVKSGSNNNVVISRDRFIPENDRNRL